MRTGLIARIDRETQAAQQGLPAWIKIKVNSIVDEQTIDALYRASQAGVSVDLVVRGICALRPGVPGLSENIRVRSILGRFLEHARIYAFANSLGADPNTPVLPGSAGIPGLPDVFIGSADLMHRNLIRRVEALVSITHERHVNGLITLIDRSMSDEVSTWHLEPDDTWTRRHRGNNDIPLSDIQQELITRQRQRLTLGH